MVKTYKKKSNKGKKYEKPLTMYPLKPEEALAAFMKIDPKKLKARVK
jgi:hypothetical protein